MNWTRKDLIKHLVRHYIWCLRHPVVVALSFVPYRILLKHPKMESISERIFDAPCAYLTKYSAKKAWNNK